MVRNFLIFALTSTFLFSILFFHCSPSLNQSCPLNFCSYFENMFFSINYLYCVETTALGMKIDVGISWLVREQYLRDDLDQETVEFQRLLSRNTLPHKESNAELAHVALFPDLECSELYLELFECRKLSNILFSETVTKHVLFSFL
jgi:hypothetical protein